MAERTYTELVKEYERLCAQTPKMRELIAHDPSAEARRKGFEHLLSLVLYQAGIQDFLIEELRAHVEQIQASLGLSPWPPVSGGRDRRKRRVRRKA